MLFWINNPFDALPMEGGRPMRYELLARALVELGHDVVWWSSDFHHLRKEKRTLEPIYRCHGFEVRLIPTLPYDSNVCWRRLRSHRQYGQKWREMAEAALAAEKLSAPDVIVISMPPLGLFDSASYLRDLCGAQVVVDIQDAWPENFSQLAPSWLGFVFEKLLLPLKASARRTYCGADCITVVADKYLQLVKSYGAVCPMATFPLGALLPDVAAEVECPEGALKLLYIGNLGSSYDLETIFAGVTELARNGVPLSMEVAGGGACQELAEVAAADSGGAINFHGYLPDERLSRLMRECDVGIIPMCDDSLVAIPNKLVDYAAYGLAVVNSLTSETATLLKHFDCGVQYEINSVASFKHAVMLYFNDREMLKAHKLNARRMAEQHFDAAKISVAMAQWLVGAVSKAR